MLNVNELKISYCARTKSHYAELIIEEQMYTFQAGTKAELLLEIKKLIDCFSNTKSASFDVV